MADEGSTVGSSSRQVIGENSESTIEINIKTLDSNIYTFRVDRDMPIPALKSMLANATGVPVERQRLIFRGKVLKDDHLLSEYHLEDGHTLHLVARQPQVQPSPGTGSEGSAHDNINRGNDSTAGAPRHRIGQVSHSVVLGTVNIAEQGESMVADVGRLVGAVLNSLGMGSLASTGQAANPSTTPNQIPSNAETEGTQNASGRTLPSNPAPAGFAILNQPFRPVHQIPQFLSTGSLPRQMVIPDSLVTLSEFINRMELALQNASQSSPPTNVRDPQRSEVPSSNVSSLPTPEMLRSVMERAQQLLRGDAAAALSHVATHLETEGNSTDPLVRGQLQAEAMHVGAAMQHLGAMLLELGRTIMLLRVGQSPGEASVNAGPAVYISPTGPNPIMVQPFPLQANSLFGVSSSPSFGGVSGPFASGDPSRNVNIHIHAGSSIAPGVSFTATRASSGEAVHGERPNSEPASRNDNGSGGSAPSHGLPSRTDVAAIPARSTAETAGHVLNVIYPVQVRSQLSVPMHSAASQGSHPTVSSGMQPNTAVVVPQPSSESNSIPAIVAQISAQLAGAFSQIPHSLQSASTQGLHPSPVQGEQSDRGSGIQPNTHVVASQRSSESNTIPAIVAQISAQLASALGGNAQGQIPHSAQYTNTEGPHPIPAHGEQPDRGSALSQTSPEPISSFVTQINAQIANALSLDNHGQSSAPGVQSSDTLSMRGGPILPGSMSSALGSENVNDHGGSVLNIEDGRSVVVNSQVADVNLHGNDGQQLQSESLHSNNLDSRGTSGMEEDSSASSISSASAICQPRDAVLNKSAVESFENTADSAAAILASLASHSSGSERQAPLGLGIGGLEPKRRGKSAKSVGKDKVPCGTPTINQNQQSISMGQQFLQSLASQSSDVNGENANNLSNTLLSVGDQSVDGMPLERQGGSGQVDIAEMMSHALQSPAFNNLLTGVAARAGVGSSGDFRSMLEQCTQSPVVRSTLNEIAQQVEGQTQGIGAMLSGFGRGQGGVDFSRMIQQMMPAVSQALGRGSARPAPVPTLQAVHQPQCNDASAGRDEGLDVRNSQVDLQQAVERIEEHSAQGDVFRAVLESASHLSGEGNSFEDLVNEFADSAELTNEFIKMLSRDLHRRLQRDPTSED